MVHGYGLFRVESTSFWFDRCAGLRLEAIWVLKLFDANFCASLGLFRCSVARQDTVPRAQTRTVCVTEYVLDAKRTIKIPNVTI